MIIETSGAASSIYPFLDNKYTRIYWRLIEKRRTERPEGYTERHHIIPKSLGGSNRRENIVHITSREHFIAHCLLARLFKNGSDGWRKMHTAIVNMKGSKKNNHWSHKRYINSRLYAISREAMARGKIGRIYIHEIATGTGRSIDKNEPVPEGWALGMSPEICARRAARVRRRYIVNPITQEGRSIPVTDPVPEGFVPGITDKARSSLVNGKSNKRMVHDPETQESIFINIDATIPIGYTEGPSASYRRVRAGVSTSRMWIHNPVTQECKFIKITEKMPAGYVMGMSEELIQRHELGRKASRLSRES